MSLEIDENSQTILDLAVKIESDLGSLGFNHPYLFESILETLPHEHGWIGHQHNEPSSDYFHSILNMETEVSKNLNKGNIGEFVKILRIREEDQRQRHKDGEYALLSYISDYQDLYLIGRYITPDLATRSYISLIQAAESLINNAVRFHLYNPKERMLPSNLPNYKK